MRHETRVAFPHLRVCANRVSRFSRIIANAHERAAWRGVGTHKAHSCQPIARNWVGLLARCGVIVRDVHLTFLIDPTATVGSIEPLDAEPPLAPL